MLPVVPEIGCGLDGRLHGSAHPGVVVSAIRPAEGARDSGAPCVHLVRHGALEHMSAPAHVEAGTVGEGDGALRVEDGTRHGGVLSEERGILVLLVERVPLVDHALARFAAAVPEHAALILAVVGAVVIRGIHQGDVCVEGCGTREHEDLTEGCLNRFLDLGAVELRLIGSTVVLPRGDVLWWSGLIWRRRVVRLVAGFLGRACHHQCRHKYESQGRPHALIVLE